MRLKGYLYNLVFVVAICAGLGPLFLILAGPDSKIFNQLDLAVLNLVGWSGIAVSYIIFRNFSYRLTVRARELGIDTRLKGFSALFEELIFELRRKFISLSTNVIQNQLSSEQELTSSLEGIVSKAFTQLKGVSAELALFDKASGLYNKALLIGRPFRRSAQAMLSELNKVGDSSVIVEVVIQPVVFAGETIGTLRVGLPRGKVPSQLDREIVYILALQAGVAIANANYTKQLMRLRSSADQMTAARTGFLANLSHEVRGPLGIILNATELILEGICGTISPEQNKTLGIVQSNGKHLLELINDVLDYSKVESGKLNPKQVDLLLQPFLKEVCTLIRSQAIEKGHRLNFVEKDPEFAICVDKRHLRQMMINLLTNAVKYTQSGGIIDVWAERTPAGRIRINVKDSGIGIAESDRNKVFAPFERIDDEYAMSQVGTGLGMPLTKRLAEVNGGRIDFESELENGSTFFLEFEGINPPAYVEEKLENKAKIDGRGDIVLVVAKDSGESDIVTRYLAKQGFSVAVAANRLEAQEILADKDVKITVVDHKILEDKSENMVESFRDSAINKNAPIVLVTSKAFESDVRYYLKAGIERCLIKPVPLHEMASICRNLIDGNKIATPFDAETETEKPLALTAKESGVSPDKVH